MKLDDDQLDKLTAMELHALFEQVRKAGERRGWSCWWTEHGAPDDTRSGVYPFEQVGEWPE